MIDKVAVYTLALCWAIAGSALAQSDLMQAARGLFKPIPTQPPAVEGVDSTPARVALGKMLYFEPRLSKGFIQSMCKNRSERFYGAVTKSGFGCKDSGGVSISRI